MISWLSKNFLEKLSLIYSPEEYHIILEWFSQEKRTTTFRINPLKTSVKELESTLLKHKIQFEKIPFLQYWYKLIQQTEKDLWHLDIFKHGHIYLQWITSQLVGEIISKDILTPTIKILDITAAPWGKTSHVSSLLSNQWEIIANELNTIRFEKLKFTLERQWCTNVKAIKWDARELKNMFPEEYFDIILADVPCSAEWRIQLSNPNTYSFLEKSWVHKKNYQLQKEILRETLPLLKTNGYMVYSTCTLDPQENEWILHFLISHYKNLKIENIDFLRNINLPTKSWIQHYKKQIFHPNVHDGIRILPSKETEWFFISKIRKIWI